MDTAAVAKNGSGQPTERVDAEFVAQVERAGMRRWMAGLVMVTVVAAVTGCIRGSASDEGRAAFAPQVGTCHRFDVQDSDQGAYAPVPCTQLHESETVHVDAFGGADTEQDVPPARRGPALRKAFGVCDAAATDYVGGEWRGARLLLRVVIPSKRGWVAGERWFRCDLGEVAYMDVTDPHPRQSSLRGILRGPSELAIGCVDAIEGPDENIAGFAEFDSCAVSHSAEYAGVFQAPDLPYTDQLVAGGPAEIGCLGVVARYVGLPEDELKRRAEAMIWLPFEPDWLAGDRGVRCFLRVADGNITKSLRNTGTKGLPISS